ncbi:protein smaug [Plakobranchus ocellatus]|uniref:Protein smaug n=1 Tax=Plakobranchus ocellatus TaxID=259542 RepID=A0AAV4CU75_9GAST|nr:protein smaug [Plakobranchus ocellatus]
MKSNNFREQVALMTSWFKEWNECEQTVALYSLLKKSSPVQAIFLDQVLQQSLAECTDVKQLEAKANDEAVRPGCQWWGSNLRQKGPADLRQTLKPLCHRRTQACKVEKPSAQCRRYPPALPLLPTPRTLLAHVAATCALHRLALMYDTVDTPDTEIHMFGLKERADIGSLA